MTPPLMRRADAAEYLKSQCGLFTTGTLAKLACIGGGPQFHKLGRHPLYKPEDLDAWLAGRLSRKLISTSDAWSDKRTVFAREVA